MSIKIQHGFRVANTTLADVDVFLAEVESKVAPVRDELDAGTYTECLVETFDQGGPHPEASVKEHALAVFRELTNDRHPGYRGSHPHSFDLDYAVGPNGDGYLYFLVHAQRADYFDAVKRIKGVEHYPYQTSTGLPEDVSESEWEQRRTDWQWLIDAARVSEVTARYTYRGDPEPNLDHILDEDVIMRHLPSRAQRARSMARNQALSEYAALHGTASLVSNIVDVLQSPRVAELTATLEPGLPDITVEALSA